MKLKKINLSTVIIVIAFLCNNSILKAQISKGNWLFEGNLGNIASQNSTSKNTGVSFTNTSNSKNFYIDIFPRAGYFLTQDLVVGTDVAVGISNGSYESTNTIGIKTSDSKSSSSYLNFGPFVRYYFPTKLQSFRFYSQIGAGINKTLSNTNEGKSFNGTTGIINSEYSYNYPKKYNAFTANGAIGMHYFLSNTAAINSNIGYYYSKAKQSSNYTSTSGGVTTTSDTIEYESNNSRLSWSLGFTIFFK